MTRRARTRAAYLYERESSCKVPSTPATDQRLPVAVERGGARAEATRRLERAREPLTWPGARACAEVTMLMLRILSVPARR